MSTSPTKRRSTGSDCEGEKSAEPKAQQQRSNAQSYVIIGGGIAGVSCAEELALGCPDDHITLISDSAVLKAATNVTKLTQTLEQFEVVHKPLHSLDYPNVSVIKGCVSSIDTETKTVYTAEGEALPYNKLCIASGAAPNLVLSHPHVIGLRDTHTLEDLCTRLATARRVCVVGNGALASELVYELTHCEVVWAVKDAYIGNTFFDSHAAAFLMPALNLTPSQEAGSGALPLLQGDNHCDASRVTPTTTTTTSTASTTVATTTSSSGAATNTSGEGPSSLPAAAAAATDMEVDSVTKSGGGGEGDVSESGACGTALGPDWIQGVKYLRKNQLQGDLEERKTVDIQFECVLDSVDDGDTTLAGTDSEGGEREWPVYVNLSNGSRIGVDFVVSATGVIPSTGFLGQEFEKDGEGAVKINEMMQTSVPDVYAAGDACAADWELSPHWFQMRLWSQARVMGLFAGKCMAGLVDALGSGFSFELFAHTTRLFGQKVILLGKYNAQGLGEDYSVLMRTHPGVEYIKVVLVDGRIVGALLVGDTDLEETFEHLILDCIDVSRYGADLLDRNIVDLEDYFD